MTEVIGVRFRHAGKVYYFAPGGLEIRTGDHVIVETARGIEYGEVRRGVHEVDDGQIMPPLKEVLRIASPEDTQHENDNREREKEAFQICKKKIAERGLDMKLIYCEYTFDNSKILFYFTSEGRVDFRDLVKELAGIFRTRIELRQVGVRDETKLLGGLGSCGRPLCCTMYLSDFAPVSIKMAKEQNLSLNPVKISGVCGRLMCCLGNEEEVYEELNRKLPGVGDLVDLADGERGEVLSVGILKQLVKVIVELPGDEREVREYPAEDVTVRIRRRDKNRMREEKESRERELRKERERQETAEKTEAVPAQQDAEACLPGPESGGDAETGEETGRREQRGRRDRRERRERGPKEDGEKRGREHGRKQENSEKTEKTERTGRSERAEKPERSGRSGNAERTERSGRGGRSEKTEKTEKAEINGRSERSERSGQEERPENRSGGRNRRRHERKPGGNEEIGNKESGSRETGNREAGSHGGSAGGNAGKG